MQVLLYCKMYALKHDTGEDIHPSIYLIQKLFRDFDPEIRIKQGNQYETIESYLSCNTEYTEVFNRCISEIFDPAFLFLKLHVQITVNIVISQVYVKDKITKKVQDSQSFFIIKRTAQNILQPHLF